MTDIINSRADLDALKGTPAYGEALRGIHGATIMWVNDAPDGAPPQWRMASDSATLTRLGLTSDELLAECAAAGVTPTTPEMPAALPADLLPPPAPLVVSRFQARVALLQAGLLEAVEAAVAASADPLVRLAWSDAVEFRSDSPTIAAIAAGLELTAAQIDALFAAAAQITA